MKKMIEKTEKESKKNTGLEINIVPLLLHLLKRLWLIVLVGIITGVMSFTAAKMFIHPTYRCGFTAYVNNKHAQSSTEYLTSSDVIAAKQLVLTYSKIIRSNTILSAAKDTMNLNYSVAQLKSMVGTEVQEDTEIIEVSVIARSPEESYKIASAIASVSPKIMAEIVEGSSMKIVEYPQVPAGIFQPSYAKYAIVGFLGGFFLTIIVLIIQYLRNDTITDENEVESRFSVPVLGVIPDVNGASNGKSGYYYNYYYEHKEEGGRNDEKA